jgi:hypothetical protein
LVVALSKALLNVASEFPTLRQKNERMRGEAKTMEEYAVRQNNERIRGGARAHGQPFATMPDIPDFRRLDDDLE